MKHSERRDTLDQTSLTKRLEKQVKDLKSKIMLMENTCSKKNAEMEALRLKLEKKA